MLVKEIIRRKRDGHRLSRDELDFLARGIATGDVGDGQAAAFAMAVFFRGMDEAETADWTRSMTASGETLHWRRDHFHGPLLDKHSSGGVGDKVSLVLAPMLAACGAFVPMISGRSLGHTGGTLDKLEAIPGFVVDLDASRFQRVVRNAGCAIVGASAAIAPADRRLYAVRDVTATIESVPLLTASILSKKLAAGLDALVLDVKTGNGAFTADLGSSRELARSLVSVSRQAGLPSTALITDMNQVLGRTAGNALEVYEAIAFLRGETPDARLQRVVFELGSEALVLGGLAADHESAWARLDRCLAGGDAAAKFQALVTEQGGASDLMDRPHAHLRQAPVVRPVLAARDGVVCGVNVRGIGNSVVALGGGRRRVGDAVDVRVGFSDILGLGEAVSRTRPLGMVHAADENSAELAAEQLRAAVCVGDEAPAPAPLIVDRVC